MSTTLSPRDPHAVLRALNDVECAPGAAAAQMQRRYARHSIRADALLQQLDDTVTYVPSIRIQLRDVSLGGLGFVCETTLKVGSLYRVVFTMKGYHFGQQVVRVCHCRAIAPGVNLIGGQFCLEPAVLCLLGVDPLQMAAPDAASAPTPQNEDADAFVGPNEL